MQPGELLTEIHVSLDDKRTSAFAKLRRRGAIDFPQLNVAASVSHQHGKVTDSSIVVSTLAARPKLIKAAARLSQGTALEDGVIATIAQAAHKQCRPLTNLEGDTEWRRDMIGVLTKDVLQQCREAMN